MIQTKIAGPSKTSTLLLRTSSFKNFQCNLVFSTNARALSIQAPLFQQQYQQPKEGAKEGDTVRPFRYKGSVNRAILCGRVGADPVVRSAKGFVITTFSIATDGYITKEGKKEANWHNIISFDEKVSQTITNSVQKGSLVFVEGKIKSNVYKNSQGEVRSSYHIIVSDPKDVRLLEGVKPNNKQKTE